MFEFALGANLVVDSTGNRGGGGGGGVGGVVGVEAAAAALLGGAISVVGNGYFMLLAFRYRGAREAQRVVRAFMRGEMGKLGITLALFALAFALIPGLHAAATLSGFGLATITGILMSGRV